jgi:hypothetical protein
LFHQFFHAAKIHFSKQPSCNASRSFKHCAAGAWPPPLSTTFSKLHAGSTGAFWLLPESVINHMRVVADIGFIVQLCSHLTVLHCRLPYFSN